MMIVADDAIMAVNSGVDAIFVSNHGGRMIDSTPATVSFINASFIVLLKLLYKKSRFICHNFSVLCLQVLFNK